ncbi:unnamed protein product [Kuraishia capsulata CBS 1993]|uniref:asparaginase n=1 Tax=Kuraishia capsulata CBS 1993 TaxID=1382522 RepID=W6MQ40_9ASCO|nr:uncharacterized protein KUCA_T00004771001 [Kuraishia capsulata CBS 1993]CDK28786.1 unnamed protein product [Kuraishia capsulata CBS 1993]
MTQPDNVCVKNGIVSSFTLESTSPNHKPRVKILGTGGTIASKADSTTQTAGYDLGLTIDQLLSQIPDVTQTCDCFYEQVCNVESTEVNDKILALLHRKVVESLADHDGVVITHGTDTMEETAFFLELVINSQKPVVLTGSMRPASALSADGPMNLYQAILVAASKSSRDRGVLVSFNDQISSGFFISKSNSNSLETFSGKFGYLGNFIDNEINYFYPPAKPSAVGLIRQVISRESVLQSPDWPRVAILYSHQGFDKELIRLSIEHLGAQGIIFAGCGAGSMTAETNEYAFTLWKRYGVPMVYSRRSNEGVVPRRSLPKIEGYSEGSIAAGYMNPQKARILLQLCLLHGITVDVIKVVFEGVFGG